MMSVATDEAVQMLQAGWTVRYCALSDSIEWRAPDGLSSHEWHGNSLDNPPGVAVLYAKRKGHIVDRPRTIGS